MSTNQQQSKRILLISSKVSHAAVQPFLLHKGASVITVEYDFDAVKDFSDLLDLVHARVLQEPELSTIESMGIMYHSGKNILQVFAKDAARSTELSITTTTVSAAGVPDVVTETVEVPSAERVESFDDFVIFARALQTFYDIVDLDLISCNLVADTTHSMLNYVMAHNSVPRINASINVSGSAPRGDWVLELGNVDMIGRYFSGKIVGSGIELGIGRGIGLRTFNW